MLLEREPKFILIIFWNKCFSWKTGFPLGLIQINFQRKLSFSIILLFEIEPQNCWCYFESPASVGVYAQPVAFLRRGQHLELLKGRPKALARLVAADIGVLLQNNSSLLKKQIIWLFSRVYLAKRGFDKCDASREVNLIHYQLLHDIACL